MTAFVAWFLNPPPVSAVPTDGLMAIASVAVVIWTGGFIVRGWMQSTAVALMAGMNYLQFAFFASILALLSNALTLRCAAVGFLFYYGSFFVRHSARLRKREPEVELFLPFLDQVLGVAAGEEIRARLQPDERGVAADQRVERDRVAVSGLEHELQILKFSLSFLRALCRCRGPISHQVSLVNYVFSRVSGFRAQAKVSPLG